MSLNESPGTPTHLVLKSSDEYAAHEYLLHFKIGQILATKGKTCRSRWSGIAGSVKFNYPATGKLSQNQISHIPTKLVPKLSYELAEQEYAIRFDDDGQLATIEKSSSRRPGITTFSK